MDWTQTLTIIGSLAGFFFYSISKMESFKKEVKGDMKDLKTELKSEFKSDIKNLKDDLRNEMNQRFAESNQRLSDFKTDVNQRLSNIENCVMPRKVFHFQEPEKAEDEPKEN